MRNDAITIGEEEQHLCVPVVRRQRPTVVKRDRLGVLRTPIFVVNLRAVFQCDRSHVPLLHLYCVVLLLNSANDVVARERGRSIAATEAAATATKSRLFIPLYATLSIVILYRLSQITTCDFGRANRTVLQAFSVSGLNKDGTSNARPRRKREADTADHAIGFSSNNRATIAESR